MSAQHPNAHCPSPSDVMDIEQCAAWLGVTTNWLQKDSRQDSPVVPVMRLGKQRRYHRRTIECEFMTRAYLSAEIIAAAFGRNAPGV